MTDVSVPAAALAGLVSFLSPCVLPIVPGYLSYISGISLVPATAEGPAGARGGSLVGAVTANTTAFVLGFTTVFVLLGATATSIGRFLIVQGPLFERVAGAVIVLFGLHVLRIVKIPLLYREKRFEARTQPRTLVGSYAVGTAFAFGWTPCIGPILAGVLTMAATQETVLQGMGLLTVYSLGLGVPFLLAALGASYLVAFITRFRRFYRAVEVTSGILLIVIGLMIFTGNFTWLSSQLGFLNRFVL
jgi:cytochrome c-type biogenesis protein